MCTFGAQVRMFPTSDPYTAQPVSGFGTNQFTPRPYHTQPECATVGYRSGLFFGDTPSLPASRKMTPKRDKINIDMHFEVVSVIGLYCLHVSTVLRSSLKKIEVAASARPNF